MTQEKIETFIDETKTAEVSDEYGPGNERWKMRPLSELIEPVLGKTPKRSEDEYWGGDIQWASAKDISQSETRHVYDTAENMTEAGKEASNAKILPAGTVVVVARGSVGEIIQLGEPMTFNQSCYALDTNDELLDDYLYYAWQYVFGQVQAVSYGTVFDTITMKSFEDIEIPLPPLNIQEWIANILTSFDDRIENNRRLHDQLQSLAETMYSGLIRGSSQYSEFKQSELGEIPKQYSVKEVGELLTLEYGEGLPEREREGDEFPVYGSNGVTGRHSESLVQGPGVIVGRKGVNFGTVKLEFDDFWPIDTTFYVEPEDGESIFYIYHVLKDMPFQHLGSDSAVPGLNRNVAHDQKVVVPPEGDREEFAARVKKYHKLQKSLSEECRILNDLLDTALPNLLSGKVAPAWQRTKNE